MTEVRIRITSETRKQLAEVRRRAFRAGDLPIVKRVSALLAIGRGEPVATIAQGIGVSAATVYRWLRQFLAQGIAGLQVHWRGGRPAGCSSLGMRPALRSGARWATPGPRWDSSRWSRRRGGARPTRCMG